MSRNLNMGMQSRAEDIEPRLATCRADAITSRVKSRHLCSDVVAVASVFGFLLDETVS